VAVALSVGTIAPGYPDWQRVGLASGYTLHLAPCSAMARPKKADLSPAVGPVNLGRKRGNPAFVSSSFYVPKQVNLRFDRALLTLKAHGFDVDRSDILSVLMDRFSAVVDAAERQGGELDLAAILAASGEKSVEDVADSSHLKGVLMKQAAEMSEANQAQIDEMRRVMQELGQAQQKRMTLEFSAPQE